MSYTTTTIDITPTWEALLPALVHCASHGTTVESRTMAMEELLKMARLADQPKNYLDERGNQIYYLGDDFESWHEFDANNNEIYHRDTNGEEYWQEYDENNNLIYRRNGDNGYEQWYTYDENNNQIHFRDSNGAEVWYEYDENNNLIHYRNNDGIKEKY